MLNDNHSSSCEKNTHFIFSKQIYYKQLSDSFTSDISQQLQCQSTSHISSSGMQKAPLCKSRFLTAQQKKSSLFKLIDVAFWSHQHFYSMDDI